MQGTLTSSEGVNESGVPEQRAGMGPIKAQSAAVARTTASICNAEWARSGVERACGIRSHLLSANGGGGGTEGKWRRYTGDHGGVEAAHRGVRASRHSLHPSPFGLSLSKARHPAARLALRQAQCERGVEAAPRGSGGGTSGREGVTSCAPPLSVRPEPVEGPPRHRSLGTSTSSEGVKQLHPNPVEPNVRLRDSRVDRPSRFSRPRDARRFRRSIDASKASSARACRHFS